MTLSADKRWQGRGEVKGGRLWTKPGMKRRSDGFIGLTHSLLSPELVYICMCAISRFLAQHDVFITLFFLSSEKMDLFVFPLPLVLPSRHFSHSFKCVCVSAYMFVWATGMDVSFMSSCEFLKLPGLWCWRQWWQWRAGHKEEWSLREE